MPRNEIASSYGNSIFRFFLVVSILFAIVATSINILTNGMGELSFLYTISSICYL